MQCCSMLTTRSWACLQRFAISNRFQSWNILRCQSTVPSRASTISPTLLSRAQALAAEHAELSTQLDREYDNQIAKKAGSLAAVATALNSWESASKVSLYHGGSTVTDGRIVIAGAPTTYRRSLHGLGATIACRRRATSDHQTALIAL